jgi:hypothetical protein
MFPPDDSPGIEPFREFAAHEAAHAVVTTGLGVVVTRLFVVQLNGAQKLGYTQVSADQVKEDCSHSAPDKQGYKDAGPLKRCIVARAGEVGQRIHIRATTVLWTVGSGRVTSRRSSTTRACQVRSLTRFSTRSANPSSGGSESQSQTGSGAPSCRC